MPSQNIASPSTRAYLYATVVLLALLGVSLTLYLLGATNPSRTLMNSTSRTGRSGSAGTAAVNRVATPPVPPEPETILSRSGTVTRVSGNEVKFSSPVYNDTARIYEMKELSATLSATTALWEIDRRNPPIPPVPGQPLTEPDKKAITKSDLRIGDVVDISAADNIKSETTFAAVEIRKLLTR